MNSTRVSSTAASLAAGILFPGFLAYHTLVAANIIPSFLAGFFAPVALAALPIIGILLFATMNPAERHFRFPLNIYLLFLIYCICWTLGWLSLSSEFHIFDAATQVAESGLLIIALFVMGIALDLNSKIIRIGFPLITIIISLMLILNFLISGEIQFDARMKFGAGEEVATYQGYATSTFIIAVLAVAATDRIAGKFALIVASLISLFMIGSRSEFVGFLLAAMAIVLILARRYRRAWWPVVGLCIFVGAAILYFPDLIQDSRFSQLADISTASSATARGQAHDFALEQIRDNPFIGYFGGHYLLDGRGTYSHDALSAWTTFGFLGFAIYAYLMTLPFAHAVKEMFIKQNEDRIWWAVLAMATITFLLGIIAKPVFWEVPGLLWGLYVQATRRPFLAPHAAESRISIQGFPARL